MSVDIRIEIEPAILGRFSECRVGGFLVRGLRSAAERVSLESADSLASSLTGQGITAEKLGEEPRVQEWRKAIKQCGLKPSDYKSSPEQLARRLLKGTWISTPLPVVNLYSAVSARHLAPLGAYDLERLPQPAVTLREAKETDTFAPLGGRPEDMPLRPQVAVYASGAEVICWAFNHRDSSATCLVPETDTALFVGEAVAGLQLASLDAALAELARELRDAGATVGDVGYADAQSPSVSLQLS